MKDEFVNLELIKNEVTHRFEMNVGDHIAFINYEQSSGKITLLHTEVPPELEGKRAAIAVIEKTLNYISKTIIN